MPKVGTGKSAKHFPYTKAGRKAAQAYARRTGEKLTVMKGK
jgi:hypothetical protein